MRSTCNVNDVTGEGARGGLTYGDVGPLTTHVGGPLDRAVRASSEGISRTRRSGCDVGQCRTRVGSEEDERKHSSRVVNDSKNESNGESKGGYSAGF